MHLPTTSVKVRVVRLELVSSFVLSEIEVMSCAWEVGVDCLELSAQTLQATSEGLGVHREHGFWANVVSGSEEI